MTDQQQRTQWALDQLDGFVGNWAPPIMQAQANSPVTADAERVKRAIRGIAPKGNDDLRIGYAAEETPRPRVHHLRDTGDPMTNDDTFMLDIEWGPGNLPDMPTKVGPFRSEGEAIGWAELSRWDVYRLAWPYLRGNPATSAS